MNSSSDARARLILKWGPEVVLQCNCGYHKSHSMLGFYGLAKCPTCKTVCKNTDLSWDQLDNLKT